MVFPTMAEWRGQSQGVAVVAFHNALAAQYPAWTYDEIKHKVILALQAIALYDFLPRIVDGEVWTRVVTGRRGCWYGDGQNGRLASQSRISRNHSRAPR